MNLIALSQSEAESLFRLLEGHFLQIVREDMEIDNLEWIADILSVWRKCRPAFEAAVAGKEELAAVSVARIEETVKRISETVDEIEEKKELEPEPEKPEKPVFYGSMARLKKATYEKMVEARAAGTSIAELSKMTAGLVNEEQVIKMLEAQKVRITSWEAMADALGVQL